MKFPIQQITSNKHYCVFEAIYCFHKLISVMKKGVKL